MPPLLCAAVAVLAKQLCLLLQEDGDPRCPKWKPWALSWLGGRGSCSACVHVTSCKCKPGGTTQALGLGRVESAQPSPATGALEGTADPIPLCQAGKFSLIPTIITLATALTSVGLVSMGAGGVPPSHPFRP